MKIVIFLIGFIFSHSCLAGEISIARSGGSNIPETAIAVRASHISIDITADASEEKGLRKEWEALARFKAQVENQAKVNGKVRVDRVASTYVGREAKKSFGSYSASNSYRLRLSTPLQESENFIIAAARLGAFISHIRPEEVVEFKVGSYSLAIENKSKYRPDLLSRIGVEVEEVKKFLGEGYQARIYDFTNKVIVEQVGEETVSLYLNYSVEYTQ